MTIYARWTFLLLLVLASFSDVTGSHWRGVVVQGGCFLALVLCLLPRTDKLRQLYSVPGLIPLAVLGGLFLLQLLPLPPLFIKLVSPATSRIYEETIWMVLPGRWMPLALDPKTSLTGFFLFWSALAVFIVTIQLTPALELTKKTFFFLSTAAGLFSLLGLFRLVFWPQTSVATGNGASFPAASSVLFSGNGSDSSILVAMTLPLIVGLFLALHPRGNVFGFAGQRLGPLLLTTQHLKLIAGVATLPVLAFLLITAQVWTLLITLGGLLLFAALVGLRKLDRKRGLLLVGMAVCFLVGVVLLRWGGDFTGFPPAKGQSPALMTQGADSLSTFRRFPLAGTGLGASGVVADASGAGNGSQSVSPGGQSFLGQFLAEGGILGGVLLVWFLSLLIGRCFQAWFRRKSRTSRYLFPGVLAGIVVLIVHGLTGRFQNPLPLAVFFSFFLGLLVSASHARSRSHDVENELAFLPLSVRGVGLVLGVGLGLSVVIFHLGGGVASLSADLGKTVVPADSSPETLKSTLGDLRLATQLDPLEYRYPLALGALALAMEDKLLALKSLSFALRLNPLNSLTLRRTGLALSASENEVVGEALLRAAAEYHPGKAQHQWDYALWLCTRSRYEDSYPYLQRIFGLEPARAGELLQLMSACGLGDEQMQVALSDIPAGWVGYGDFLLTRGTEMEAEKSYELAVRFATGSKNSLALPFWRLSEFYSERNRPQEALDTVLSGLQEFPADPRLRLAAGTLYQKMGITYRAIEEYRKALLLDPNNELARLGLKELTNGY